LTVGVGLFYARIGSTKGALPTQQVLIASAPHCFRQFVSDRQKMAQPIPQEARHTELQISVAGETALWEGAVAANPP
jgi:hypothetical protein